MISYGSASWWKITLALCLGSFMIFSNLYVTQPLLPTLAAEFSVSPLQASYTLTISTLTLGIALIFYGSISDAIGRRVLILLSMCGVVAVGFALSFVRDYSTLLILRALQGILLAGLPAIAVAYMADEFTPEALISAVGLYIAANSLGGISGRLISGITAEQLGWEKSFLVVAILSAVLTLVVFVLLPKQQYFQPRSLNFSEIAKSMVGHLGNRKLIPAYLLGGLNFFAFVNQYSYITFVLEAEPYSLTPKFLGLLFLTYLTGTLGSTFSGKFGKKFGQPQCMMAGSIILIFGTLVTLFDSLILIVLGFFINAFGFFLAHSSASSWVSRNAQHSKGAASSLYLLFYYVGASTGGIYLSYFWEWRFWEGVVFGSILVFITTFALALYLKNPSSRHTEEVNLQKA